MINLAAADDLSIGMNSNARYLSSMVLVVSFFILLLPQNAISSIIISDLSFAVAMILFGWH